jgi:hypothetical protein
MQAPDDGDLFALLRAAPQRELPACVLNALEVLTAAGSCATTFFLRAPDAVAVIEARRRAGDARAGRDAPAGAASAPPAPPQREVSLDLLRGLAMVILVASWASTASASASTSRAICP